MGDLLSKLESVHDRDSFLDFAKALTADRRDRATSAEWENSTIEDFLASAVAWAENSEGQPTGLPLEPTWRAFATFLYCGKIYE